MKPESGKADVLLCSEELAQHSLDKVDNERNIAQRIEQESDAVFTKPDRIKESLSVTSSSITSPLTLLIMILTTAQ